MLGILKERLGLYVGAAKCFRKAVNLSSNEHCDMARINYGRLLIKLGHYQKAVEICSDVQESSFKSGIWYALALYKDMQFEESSCIYLAIAEHLAEDKFSMGDVLACVAIIKYVLGKPELAKEMFIESFSQSLPTAKVMYALIALGVLQKDQPLVALTLSKIEDLEDVPKSIEDFITVLSYVHIYQGNYMKAIRKTSEMVHLLPNNSSLWFILALTLLHSLEYMNSPLPYARAANRAALIALEMRSLKDNHRQISKIMCIISHSFSLIREKRAALISAQKAVHCTPDARECWMVLNKSLDAFPNKQASNICEEVLYSPSLTFEQIRTNSLF
ncbi:hypothetical protein WA026_013346 [Henosepilachna vigintioctopunctata]|uniref:Uncharacterized protein n=1 Tax=Henosepilachna vigintioctopunctata TaxID=420089 RepID=A0AAW1VC08_9CUCU